MADNEFDLELVQFNTPNALDTYVGAVLASSRRKLARNSDPRYLNRLKETQEFLKGVYNGIIGTHHLQEVLSTSDFPIIFGDIVDRQMLGMYQTWPSTWPKYMKRGTVRDFRASRRIALDGMEQPWYPTGYKKPELTNVNYDNDIDETGYTTQVQVYEKGYALNWRMVINDDLDAMSSLPARLARGAARTEGKFSVDLYVDSTGPNSTFFAAGNANLVTTAYGAATSNPPLSVQGLRDAFNVMLRQTDASGDPIFIEGAVLVVPPALRITAMEILSAGTLQVVPATSAQGTRYEFANWLRDLTLVVEPYLPVIDTSANKHTTWYLFANPSSGRPAVEMTFLRGYEQPQVYQKAPNTMRLGGSVDPVLGDFEDMSYHYKGILIIGGTLLDPKMAVVSNGSGS